MYQLLCVESFWKMLWACKSTLKKMESQGKLFQERISRGDRPWKFLWMRWKVAWKLKWLKSQLKVQDETLKTPQKKSKKKQKKTKNKAKSTKPLCAYNGVTRGNLFFQFLLFPPPKKKEYYHGITMVLPWHYRVLRWCYHGITGYYHGMTVVMRWC